MAAVPLGKLVVSFREKVDVAPRGKPVSPIAVHVILRDMSFVLEKASAAVSRLNYNFSVYLTSEAI